MYKWTLENVDNGNVLRLERDPYGWESLILTHTRDEKWHGVFYYFSTELGFYCNGGGREFVEAAYNAKGSESTMRITLDYECNGSFTNVFKGRLNFSSYRLATESGLDGIYMNVENNNIAQILKKPRRGRD